MSTHYKEMKELEIVNI